MKIEAEVLEMQVIGTLLLRLHSEVSQLFCIHQAMVDPGFGWGHCWGRVGGGQVGEW